MATLHPFSPGLHSTAEDLWGKQYQLENKWHQSTVFPDWMAHLDDFPAGKWVLASSFDKNSEKPLLIKGIFICSVDPNLLIFSWYES